MREKRSLWSEAGDYRIGACWIADPEFWAKVLDARNGSVHDYFGISRDAYLKIMKRFVAEAEGVVKRIVKGETA